MYLIISDHFSRLDIDSFADSAKEETEDTEWISYSLPVFSLTFLPWKNSKVTVLMNSNCGQIAVFRKPANGKYATDQNSCKIRISCCVFDTYRAGCCLSQHDSSLTLNTLYCIIIMII